MRRLNGPITSESGAQTHTHTHRLPNTQERCPDSESLSLPFAHPHSAVSVLPETSEEPGPVTFNDGGGG